MLVSSLTMIVIGVLIGFVIGFRVGFYEGARCFRERWTQPINDFGIKVARRPPKGPLWWVNPIRRLNGLDPVFPEHDDPQE